MTTSPCPSPTHPLLQSRRALTPYNSYHPHCKQLEPALNRLVLSQFSAEFFQITATALRHTALSMHNQTSDSPLRHRSQITEFISKFKSLPAPLLTSNAWKKGTNLSMKSKLANRDTRSKWEASWRHPLNSSLTALQLLWNAATCPEGRLTKRYHLTHCEREEERASKSTSWSAVANPIASSSQEDIETNK